MRVASIAYWVTGGLVALQFLRNYVLNFLYTANTKQLRIERVYGSGRPRFLADVYFSRAKAFGEVDALKARFAQAKIVHAVHRRERLPIQALAYEDTDGLKILLFQPNEALCAHVRQAAARKPREIARPRSPVSPMAVRRRKRGGRNAPGRFDALEIAQAGKPCPVQKEA